MKNFTTQRWLALGLLFVVIVIVTMGIIYPLISNGLALYEEKQSLLLRRERLEKIISRKDVVKQNLETIKSQFKAQGYFTNRDTESLASADLQNVAKTKITDAGGQLNSTQALAGKVENGFNRITVRVRLNCSLDALRTILYNMSTELPVMLVSQIDITPVRGGKTAKGKDSPNLLNVSFEVVSFMRTNK